MESIYYVMSWLCHRQCRHCYEERFHPYAGDELDRVAAEARSNFPRIIANLPERLSYLDLKDPDGHGGFREKIGRIILSGGEILLEPVRETVLYPAITMLQEKYRAQGGVKIVIQTTGDTLSEPMLNELLDLGVWMIAISGVDAHHQGLETESAREALRNRLATMFQSCGMKPSSGMQGFEAECESCGSGVETGPWYHFFGATPESWIGKLWPRGRAQANELSQAGMADNFCNAWSGGLNFLRTGWSGSEVSIEPNGNVYPCCIKTGKPLGSLLETSLDLILKSASGDPVYEAISSGHPERMGIQHGWSEEKFLEMSAMRLPSGRICRNLCMGCDRFHEEVLSGGKAADTSVVSLP